MPARNGRPGPEQRRHSWPTTPGASRPARSTPAPSRTPPPGPGPCPIYQTTAYQFRDTDPRRQPVRAGRGRQHLHPDHEPDPGRARGPRRHPRGCARHRASASPARWPCVAARRPTTFAILNLAEAGSHIVSSAVALRRHVQPLPLHAAASSASTTTFVDDPDDLDAWRGRDPAEHQGVLRRDASATPATTSSTSRASRASPTRTACRSSSTTPSPRRG